MTFFYHLRLCVCSSTSSSAYGLACLLYLLIKYFILLRVSGDDTEGWRGGGELWLSSMAGPTEREPDVETRRDDFRRIPAAGTLCAADVTLASSMRETLSPPVKLRSSIPPRLAPAPPRSELVGIIISNSLIWSLYNDDDESASVVVNEAVVVVVVEGVGLRRGSCCGAYDFRLVRLDEVVA